MQIPPSLPVLSIVRILWKSRLVIFGSWIAGSLITLFVVSRIPAVYKAESLIVVDSQKIPERYVSSSVSTDVQDRLATINQQILSATRLQKIIDDFNLYREERKKLSPEEILEAMRKDMSIKIERGWTGNRPGAFHVGYSGTDPNTVAMVTNRISNLYVDENLRAREVQAEGTAEFMSTQLEEAKKTLDALEARVSQYKVSHTGELPEQQVSLISTLAQLRASLDANRDAMNRNQETRVLLESNLNMTEVTLVALDRAVESSRASAATPVVKPKLQSEILQDNYETLRKRYSEDHPEMQAMRKNIETAKDHERNMPPPAASPQTKRNEDEILQTTLQANQMRERLKTIKAQIALSDKEAEARKIEQQQILKETSAYQARLGRLPIREQEMAQLLRDYEISKANYKNLLDKKLSAEMGTAMEHRQKSERFTIVDAARPPTKPTKPNRPLWNILGSLISLLMGGGVALIAGLGKDLFLGEWELPEGVPVLGRLPHIAISPSLEERGRPKSRGPAGLRRQILVPSALLCCIGVAATTVYFILQRS